MPRLLKFINHSIEDFAMQVTYNPIEGTGQVVYNLSVFRTSDLAPVVEIIRGACRSGVCVSDLVKFIPEGESLDGYKIPQGSTGICTVCSITLDGLLLKRGVPLNPIGGGVIEIVDRIPRRFTQIIRYEDTTIDPLQVLVSQDITSISRVISTGNGTILANIRECHMEAEPLVAELLDDLADSRFTGVLEVGMPNSPLLGVQISPQYIGMVAVGGTNPIAAVKEAGYPVITRAMKGLLDVSEMEEIGTSSY
jgi:repressor of nif and glnA expression